MIYYSPIIAALVTLLVTAVLLLSKLGRKVQDVPNERSLHTEPIPRIGGVALMAGTLAGWLAMFSSVMWWVLLPLLALFAVSLLDDLQGLPVWQRLLAHLVAAIVLVSGSGMLAQGVVPALIVILCVVWMTNLYNFMDGSDGLAGGMALFGFTAYGVAAWMHGDETHALLNFSISAAALGFLYYNFYPAKVFMGDAGSIPLGFLAGAMGLWGWQMGHWPAWFPLLVFSPFIVDASVTLLKRTVRGVKITEAHREHYYQRLVQIGWGHRNVAVFAYALMFAAGVSAIFGLLQQQCAAPWVLCMIWGVTYALMMLLLDGRWRTFQRKQHG